MGIYLNPGNETFKQSIEKDIYVDKSLLIDKIWNNAKRINKYICIARPRRFGKSTDAAMLAAYFSKGCNSHILFDNLNISNCNIYENHLNKHNVIYLNIQNFLSRTQDIQKLIQEINNKVIRELKREYSKYCEETDLSSVLEEIFVYENQSFIFILDEWDCPFRSFKEEKKMQEYYLDYLRLLLKDHPYVEFAYMTGILPIKKYGTHSALNMFDEISMIDAKDYSAFMGFTEKEVEKLCHKHHIDFKKMQEWYDGYCMRDGISTYSPRSVTASIFYHDFANYWSQTETYEALKSYIDLNYDGLKDTIIDLLMGNRVIVDTLSFQNDMTTFSSKEDVLTLLIHLGYLSYCYETGEVFIPNNEVKNIFVTSIKNSNWFYVSEIFKNANDLLEATWKMQAEKVALYIERSHYETSILQYNDENALAYTISLAYITAKEYYTIVREFPTGKGFADMVFIPKKDKPAMIIELKWNKNVETGIAQIKNKKYYFGLEQYLGQLLLVSINYDKGTKKHQCIIEPFCT